MQVAQRHTFHDNASLVDIVKANEASTLVAGDGQRKRESRAKRREAKLNAYARRKMRDPCLKERLILAGLAFDDTRDRRADVLAGETASNSVATTPATDGHVHYAARWSTTSKQSDNIAATTFTSPSIDDVRSFHTAEQEYYAPVTSSDDVLGRAARIDDETDARRLSSASLSSSSNVELDTLRERERQSNASSIGTLALTFDTLFPHPPPRRDIDTLSDDGTILPRGSLDTVRPTRMQSRRSLTSFAGHADHLSLGGSGGGGGGDAHSDTTVC